MIEIYKNLFIGNANDFELKVRNEMNWNVVHACKEPYHRQLLGYTGRGAPKNHSEYLFAVRENVLYLNLVDAEDSAYFPKEVIDKALSFVKMSIEKDIKCLVHCNQGESRSPGIGLLFLKSIGHFNNMSFTDAERNFIKIYPLYKPSNGMRGYIEKSWINY